MPVGQLEFVPKNDRLPLFTDKADEEMASGINTLRVSGKNVTIYNSPPREPRITSPPPMDIDQLEAYMNEPPAAAPPALVTEKKRKIAKKRKVMSSSSTPSLVKKPKTGLSKYQDPCIEAAIKAGHFLVVKFGPSKSSDFQHFGESDAFIDKFQKLGQNRCAWEVYHDQQPRRFIMDLEGYYTEEKDNIFKMGYVEAVVCLIKRMLKIDPRFITFDGSRWNTTPSKSHPHRMGMFKVSLHLIFHNVQSPVGDKWTSDMGLAMIEAAWDDKDIRPYLFFKDLDKDECVIDRNIYGNKRCLRMPYSNKIAFKEKKLVNQGPAMIWFQTPYDINFKFHPRFGKEREKFNTVILEHSFITDTYAIDDYDEKGERKRIPIFNLDLKLLTPKPKEVKEVPRRRHVVRERIENRDEIKNQDSSMKMLQRIVETQFPEQGAGTSVVPTNSHRIFKLRNHKGRTCIYGPYHETNDGVFYIGGNWVDFYCYSNKCSSSNVHVKRFFPDELKKRPAWDVLCLSLEELIEFKDLNMHLFNKVASVYQAEADELGLKDKKPIPTEIVDEARELANRWKRDVHAVINHFSIRIKDNSCCHSVLYEYKENEAGRVIKTPKEMDIKDIQAQFTDVDVKFASVSRQDRKKRIDDDEGEDIFIWKRYYRQLGDYLTAKKGGSVRMEQSEKIVYQRSEFYPALPDEDPRTLEQKRDTLNLYVGIDHHPNPTQQYYDGLSEEEKKDIDEKKDLLNEIHLLALCDGDIKFHQYALKFAAMKYRKPWIKTDAHMAIAGPPGIGKSVFYSTLFHKLFGSQYSWVIKKIEDLTDNWNSTLTQKLVVTCEEVSGANNYKVHNLLKALLDTTQRGMEKKKFKEARSVLYFYAAWFLSNEVHHQNMDARERRYKAVRGSERKLAEIAESWGYDDIHAMFDAVANYDPRILGLLLLDQDIENFSYQRDAPRTLETVRQVMLSFEKLSTVRAFWAALLDDQLYTYLKDAKKDSKMLSTVKKALSQTTSDPKEILNSLRSIFDSAPLNKYYDWAFLPSDTDWEEIMELFRKPQENKQLKKELAVLVKAMEPGRPLYIDSDFYTRIQEAIIQVDRHKIAKYLRMDGLFTKGEFYQELFIPFKENIEKTRSVRQHYTSNAFWRQTNTECFGDNFLKFPRKKTNRIECVRLNTLFQMRERFAQLVLGKADFYTLEIDAGVRDY